MKKTFAIIVLTLFTFFVFANEWTISQVSENLYEGTREDGKNVSIFTHSELSSELLDKIKNCLNVAWNIPGIEGSKTSVNVEENSTFRFIVYPTALNYENLDLSKYLPVGISFYYDTALFYDVTLKVENLVPKITGAYISPKDLLSELKNVTISPDLYMSDDYILERIARLENAVMALSKKSVFSKIAEVDPALVFAIRSLYNENPNLTSKQILSILKEQGFTVSASDVSAVRLVFLGIID